MAIKKTSEELTLGPQSAPKPLPEHKKKTFADLPQEVLTGALIPALRDADVMAPSAQADRSIHHANLRFELSRDLKNIALGVKLLEPKTRVQKDVVDVDLGPSADDAARVASAAFYSLVRINQFVTLRAGFPAPASSEMDKSASLAEAAEVVRKNVHLVLGAHPADAFRLQGTERRQLQESMSLLKEKFCDALFAQGRQLDGTPLDAQQRFNLAILNSAHNPGSPNINGLPSSHELFPGLQTVNLLQAPIVPFQPNPTQLPQSTHLVLSADALAPLPPPPGQPEGLAAPQINETAPVHAQTHPSHGGDPLNIDASHQPVANPPSYIGRLLNFIFPG